MTIDNNIRVQKLQYDITRVRTQISALSLNEINEHEHLTDEETLPSDQSRIIEEATFTYFPLGKAFEN